MFKLLFSLVFAFFALLAMLIGFLKGKNNKWQYNVSKMIFTAAAAILSMLLSALAAYLVATLIYSLLTGTLSSLIPELSELVASASAVKAVFSMIVAPLLFYPVFCICRPILGIFTAPTAAAMSGIKTDENGDKLNSKQRKARLKGQKTSAVSSLVGALSGFLIFCVMCIPAVCGLSTLGGIASAATLGGGKVLTVHEIFEGMSSNAATVTMKITGGVAIYRGMTTYPVDGHMASLNEETDFIASVLTAASSAAKDTEEYNGEETCALFFEAADEFADTTVVPTIIPEFVHQAETHWNRGEEFFGIGDPRSSNPTLEPATSAVFDALAAENFETCKEDVATLLHTVGTLAKHHHLPEFLSDPISFLDNEEDSAAIIKELLKNERMHTLVAGITESGVIAFGNMIDIHSNVDGLYQRLNEELTDEISDFIATGVPAPTTTVESGEEDTVTPDKALSKRLSEVFGKYGIKLTDQSLSDFSQKALSSFADGNVTGDGVNDLLASNDVTVVTADGNEQSVRLDSQEVFEGVTHIVSADNIEFNYGTVSDIDNEAVQLARGFKYISEMFHNLNGDKEYPVDVLMRDIGPILDCFASTETIGKQNTRSLLVSILQSERSCTMINLSLADVTDMAEHICDSSDKESYTNLLGGLSQTVNVIQAANEGGDTEGAVKQLMNDLTPTSAETIQTLSTPKLMENYGVPERSAGATADLVSDIFGNLSDVKEQKQLTDEQYDAEAKAVSDMMNIALNANKGNNKTFGEGSATGITATDFVQRVVNSEVISNTLTDTVYGDGSEPKLNPLNSTKELSEEETTELVTALNSELASTSAEEKEEKAKVLVSAAAILNISVQITDSGIVLA